MTEKQILTAIRKLEIFVKAEETKLKDTTNQARKELKSLRVKLSFYTENRQRGAIKKRDDQKIIELRKLGLTMKQIAVELGCSTTPVQEALKALK